jgi:putative lipoic acid-binding regulatory protein
MWPHHNVNPHQAGAMDDRANALERLKQAHSFPGPYRLKAIGENSAAFVARVMQAVILVLGPKSLPHVETRQSAQGKHQSVNLTVQVAEAEQVLKLYDALRGVVGVRFLL